MNLVNIGLDLLFVWHFGMGARGVGLGTACAEWTALATGLVIAGRCAGGLAAAARPPARCSARGALSRLFAVNADIMVRTIALLLLFGWFTNAGARLGATTLAANQVLMQFVSVSRLRARRLRLHRRIARRPGDRRADRAAALLRAIRLTGEFSLGSRAACSRLLICAVGAAGRSLC